MYIVSGAMGPNYENKTMIYVVHCGVGPLIWQTKQFKCHPLSLGLTFYLLKGIINNLKINSIKMICCYSPNSVLIQCPVADCWSNMSIFFSSVFGQITQESSSQHWLDHCLPFSDVRFLSMIEWYQANFSLLSAFICACLILLVSLMQFLLSSQAFFLILSFFSISTF